MYKCKCMYIMNASEININDDYSLPTFSPTFSPTMEQTLNNDDDNVSPQMVLIVFFSAFGYFWFMVVCLCLINPYKNVSDDDDDDIV